MTALKNSFTVLIPDGESEFALFVAHCLAPFPNVRVFVLSGERYSPIRFSRYCYTYLCKQIWPDDQARLDGIADIIKKNKIDILLPTHTEWISFAVAQREALSKFVAMPPLPNPKLLEIANNKWLLAQFLEENAISHPPTILLTCDDSFEMKLRTIDFPVLLKPVAAWGGEGIRRFDTVPDLKRYVEQQISEKVKCRFIVQSFRSGFVVGVNVLAQDGELQAFTMQRGIIPNTQKYAAAGAIQFIREEKFLTSVQKLISTLNWSGFANLDTLFDSQDGQLKLLEINARFWGSLRGSLLAGVSFPYLACLAALNIPFPMPEYKLVRYVHPQTALRQLATKLLPRNRGHGFTFHETGLQFLLADPLAEASRAFRQQFLSVPTD